MPFGKRDTQAEATEQIPASNPPSYDYATGSSSYNAPQPPNDEFQPLKGGAYKAQPSPQPQPTPDYTYFAATPSRDGPMMHKYQNPMNGHIITTHLPPDHPEMICLQEGRHITTSRFGVLGVLAAIIWFPWGIACCLIDRRVSCRRCGRVLDDGLTC